MEDTLRVSITRALRYRTPGSLNPCFNGRYSQSVDIRQYYLICLSLNPCFNGRYSQRDAVNFCSDNCISSLNPCFNGRYSQSWEAIKLWRQTGMS